jgi:hypothetical protein
MSGFQDFTFDSGDDTVGKKTDRYKGKEGETDRVSFVWFQTDEDGHPQLDEKVRFTGCERHYVQGVGYFLNKGPEFSKIAGGPPKQAVATIMVVWPSDSRGRLDAEAFKRGEGYKVVAWVFAADKYDQLKRRNDEHPLNECDMILACTDTQFQKMDISPARESLFRKLYESQNEKGKSIAKAILDEVENVEKNLRQTLARDLTLDQLREKMGGATAGPVADASGEDVDGLLDNLLD